ncbi:phosphomethylpyrimidine synthase ThiC, partial [bacterium]|nr:phosphomethylpyrimidine synthase ThiC [bacterium]
LHAADIAKGVPGARDWDDRFSAARKALDWDTMMALCLNPEKAKSFRDAAPPSDDRLCSMCGEYCAVQKMSTVREKESE